MIYHLLRLLFKVAFRQYFRKIDIHHSAAVPTDRPILYVANHSSSFMDAVLIATVLDHPLHFVSRGESFDKKWKRRIWSWFNMHPIYRKDKTPGLAHKNRGIIEGFQHLLLLGKSILIFPEGISKVEPRLREIKTGAARIALGAAAVADASSMPLVVPIGLSYTDPHQFRSEVILHFGAPIGLDEYMPLYATAPRKAVSALTDQIATTLESLTLCIPDERLEEVVDAATAVFEEELLELEPADRPAPQRRFVVRKELIRALHFFRKDLPFRLQQFKADLECYHGLLSNYEIDPRWLREEGRSLPDYGRFGLTLLGLLLAAPLFLIGWLNHFPVLRLTGWVVGKLNRRSDFRGSLLVSLGVLFCLMNYGVQLAMMIYFSGSLAVGVGYALALPVLGVLSLRYIEWYGRIRLWYKRWSFTEADEGSLKMLKERRRRLIRLMHVGREDYLLMR